MQRLMIFNTVTLAFITSFFFPIQSFACSCISLSSEESMARSDLVFEGYVLESKTTASAIEVEYTFNNLNILKGSERTRVTVVSSVFESACGTSFEKNVKYKIYAEEHDDRLFTGMCSSSRALPFTWDELKDEAAARSEYLLTNNPLVAIETRKLQEAGCRLHSHGASINTCYEGDDLETFICVGFFSSVFIARDNSSDQNSINFQWNRKTDEIEFTSIDAVIYPDECVNGMDGRLRWERARTLNAD